MVYDIHTPLSILLVLPFSPRICSMLKTLERYQKCSYGAVEVSKPGKELEVRSNAIVYNIIEITSLKKFHLGKSYYIARTWLLPTYNKIYLMQINSNLLFFICHLLLYSRAATVSTWSWKQDLNLFKGPKGEFHIKVY